MPLLLKEFLVSDSLKAISPLDGRYSKNTEPLSDYFSEHALIKYRTKIEIEYLISLSLEKGIEEVKSFVVNLSKSLKSKIDDDMKEAYLELFKEVIMLDKNVHENERILYRLLCEQWDHKSDI